MAHVLVIEDDHSIAMLLALVLGHEGHEVEICADGTAALARLDGPPTDAVIADVMLPSEATGLDVVEELRRRRDWAFVPAIVVSALGDDGHQWNGWRAGATGYMVKPFDTDELVALLHEQIDEALRERAANRHEVDPGERHAIPAP